MADQEVEEEGQIIDLEDYSLEDWLQLLKDPPPNRHFVNYMFPTDIQRDEYLDTVGNRPLREVKWLLLKLLPPSSPLGSDERSRAILPELLMNNLRVSDRDELLHVDQRMLVWAKTGKINPRESIYWVVDLIDEFPKEALQALEAYALLHAGRLPDGRLSGLFDCMAIIRARYLSSSVPDGILDEIFDSISPRDMEHLVERLYTAMGYETTLTPYSKDGGYDVVAQKIEKGLKTRILIDAKHYHRKVDLKLARQIVGVVSLERASKGVIVTTGKITRDARNLERNDPRLELIDREDFCKMMNQYCGRNWVKRIDQLISESKLAMQKNPTSAEEEL